MRFAPGDLPSLTSTTLIDEEMVLAIPREHALAHKPRQPVTLKMLNGEGFVLYRRSDGVGIYDWLIASLASRGFVPRITHEVHRMMASINLVAAGAGLSFVPASVQALHQEAVVYRPLATKTLPRLPLYLVHRTNQDLVLVKNFVKMAMTVPTTGNRR